jgi:xylan 1,4-beta-xylosidase
MVRNQVPVVLAAVLALVALTCSQSGSAETRDITIDATSPARPFPHFWEQIFGSGRAVLSLRERYRADLRDVKHITDFKYVRFHAILHDEVGVYDEDEKGQPIYNFSYIDQIYDGLIANGVRPFVEISFMPQKLALRQDVHAFWYKQIVSPPKDYGKWDDLMRALARHLIERYGIDEVAEWYFEVWNEPNIDFWTGEPKQSTYFELYDHTAKALKSVDKRIRVGGPSTSSAHWVDDFLRHADEAAVPVDFVSSHGYADDTVEDLFGTSEQIPMEDRVCRAIGKVRDQIARSKFPSLPLMWTEWNVPSFDSLNARDTTYVGAAIADHIRQCDGLVSMTSFWTFSDVFEENGPGKEPFNGCFGLMALGGIRKPSYSGFALLHRLGVKRIPNEAKDVLVTQTAGGRLSIALWNLVPLDKQGASKTFNLKFSGVSPSSTATITRVDQRHANSLAAYRQMGSPRYPTRKQIEDLNRAAELPIPERVRLENGSLRLEVPVNGLALVEIR